MPTPSDLEIVGFRIVPQRQLQIDGMRVAFVRFHDSQLSSKQVPVARGAAASRTRLDETIQMTTNSQRLQNSVQRFVRFDALLLLRR